MQLGVPGFPLGGCPRGGEAGRRHFEAGGMASMAGLTGNASRNVQAQELRRRDKAQMG